MTPRFTIHSYQSYWWIRDNNTEQPVKDRSGSRRLLYRPRTNIWTEISKAKDRAKRKADKLNAAVKQGDAA
jgi:hypothetical protein